MTLGNENGFAVDTTSDASWFQDDSLKKYSAVVFLNTTGNLLNNYQEADFERYIQSGGGFAGVHAASDAEYDWGWYGRLVGGYFNGHPEPQEATLHIVDSTHPSTRFLPATWKRTDEWYNFKKLNKDVHVLLTIDEKSYQGGKNGENHPMAWYHEYDGGRAWYTELGHTDESYTDSLYLKHLLGGILYAIGDNKKPDYSKAVSLRVPEENRFVKTALAKGTFFEPTEMTILPNLDILVAQRRGEIMLYKHDSKTVQQAGYLSVYWKKYHSNDMVEEGLLGMAADPDFKNNHFVYIYYSPYDTSVNRLSRFTLTNDSIDNKSEKIILQVASDRETCCHTGGSIAFGNDHLLFLSAGDNTNPFDEPHTLYPSSGYGPMDDRPGHSLYDARRSAGNTNDLRGKIMRIKIKPDGTYEIPDGNLFPKGEPKTRPEIYVMGDRNPYRITFDKTTGYLYWGEVGPDAQEDSPDQRGSRGYDEINQARKAGYFGWPLFVGDNYPYHQHDYATGKNGPLFDPAKPINDSRNNTGLRELPPAQPAFIWYPYAESPDFPQIGSGGRCAMAGPVYHASLYPEETRMPAYYDGKLFIYDWTRGWFKAITMLSNGDFDNMEPFMGHTKFNAPCDVEMGPDGKLYILEYGNGWYSKNADAGLSRIDFNSGNRPPAIDGFSVDKRSGALPLKVTATVKARDPENGALTYNWDLGDGTKVNGASTIDHTYTTPGEYAISVTVSDAEKAGTPSDPLLVYAGNEAPEVSVKIRGNQTFYFPGSPVDYTVNIDDKDDTAKVKDLNDLMVTADYKQGDDDAQLGDQFVSSVILGKNVMLSNDCKTCHKPSEKSVGPAFELVARRYEKDPNAVNYLSQKIRKGGSGVWGEVSMPAHPSIRDDDLKSVIGWIQSLSAGKTPSLPAVGTLNATLNKPVKDDGLLIISATYTDKGGPNVKALSGSGSIVLKNNLMYLDHMTRMIDFAKYAMTKNGYLSVPDNTGWVSIPNIDLTAIRKVSLAAQWEKGPIAPYSFEIRLDSPDGKKIGGYSFKGVSPGVSTGASAKTKIIDRPYQQFFTIPIDPVSDGTKHTLYIVSKPDGPTEGMGTLGLWYILFGIK
jgi:glucose/arabinose dehydrogenase/cytochrome c551/c552